MVDLGGVCLFTALFFKKISNGGLFNPLRFYCNFIRNIGTIIT